MGDPAIVLDGVRLAYPGQPPLPRIDAAIPPGSLTAITGANGSGKSTLLKAIAGLMRPAQGMLSRAGCSLAYLAQTSELPRDFPIDVAGLVSMGFWRKRGGFGAVGSEQKSQIGDALTQVGLTGFERRSLTALSAGQFQRTLFARLIVEDTDIILLDEPFNAVDQATMVALLGLVEQWHEEGRTVLCVLHDLMQVERHFNYCLHLDGDGSSWRDLQPAPQPGKVVPPPRKERLS